mmetsp:Transcript_104228/g.270112  ORF Transcript_104228/g.270112 Transcript_104228/m.270112 type:complete len:105 (-) Transcript_104228:272-586(-)
MRRCPELPGTLAERMTRPTAEHDRCTIQFFAFCLTIGRLAAMHHRGSGGVGTAVMTPASSLYGSDNRSSGGAIAAATLSTGKRRGALRGEASTAGPVCGGRTES